MRCRPMNNCVCPLGSVRTRCAFQTLRNKVSDMGLRYNTEMLRRYGYVFLTATSIATLFLTRSSAQDFGSTRVFLQPNTLPAIDRGVVDDRSHAPGSRETLTRQSIRTSSVPLDRIGRSGTHYVAGRVIVKFRDGMPTESRSRAMSSVSPAGAALERPSYANFDLVRID